MNSRIRPLLALASTLLASAGLARAADVLDPLSGAGTDAPVIGRNAPLPPPPCSDPGDLPVVGRGSQLPPPPCSDPGDLPIRDARF